MATRLVSFNGEKREANRQKLFVLLPVAAAPERVVLRFDGEFVVTVYRWSCAKTVSTERQIDFDQGRGVEPGGIENMMLPLGFTLIE